MIAALALPSAVTAKGPPFHSDPNPVYAGKKVRVFGKPGDGCGPGALHQMRQRGEMGLLALV